MKSQEMLSSLAQGSQSRADEAKAKSEAAAAELKSFSEAGEQLSADLKSERDAGYDEGFAKGKEESGGDVSDKVFSLEELNAEVKSATDPLNKKINDQAVALESMSHDLEAVRKELADLKAAPVPEDKTPFAQSDIDAAVAPLQEKIASMGMSAEDEDALGQQIADLSQRLRKPVAPVL